MTTSEGVTRREFVSVVGGSAVGAAVSGTPTLAAQPKRRYAIVGTGVRAVGMWGRAIAQQYSDVVEFAGLILDDKIEHPRFPGVYGLLIIEQPVTLHQRLCRLERI